MNKLNYKKNFINKKTTIHTDCGGGWIIRFFNYYVNVTQVTGKEFEESMHEAAKELVKLFNSDTSTTFTDFFIQEMFKNYLPNKEEYSPLTKWLLSHEDDIAIAMDDFAQLRPVFKLIIGHKALSNEEKDAERKLKNEELSKNMTRPSYVIEHVFNLPLTPAQRLQADRWRFNKLELETGSASQ